jgi:hypothetical protein
MHRHKNADQTAYCRRQASICVTAASGTAIAEVKQAYLNLEQGWLCLAPKVEASPDCQIDPGPGRDSETKPTQTPKESAVGDLGREAIRRRDPTGPLSRQ